MASNLVRIARIGEKISSEKISKNSRIFDGEFFFNGLQFKLLIDIEIRKVIKDVGIVPAFQLQICDESLWLEFDPNLMEFRNRSGRYLRSTKHLVETFFFIEQGLFSENDEIVINDEIAIEPTNGEEEKEESDAGDDEELPVKIIDDLYKQLREAHRNKPLPINYTDEFIQHTDLRPTLTPYQIDGVRWMLNRECVIDCFPTEFVEVEQRWPDTQTHVKFFYNERTTILQANKNPDSIIPKGGCLADAMGLGKTVEMLDLILLNQRPQHDLNENHQHETPSNDDDEEFIYLRCLCANQKFCNTVECSRCRMYQHRVCVSQRNTPAVPDSVYICPTCWLKEPAFKAKTTFIVSPPSIKLQWRDEVIKHVKNENFKVLVYDGLKNSNWINPMELASYDIVITDYNTLQSEFYYSNPTSRTLRRPSRYLSVRSPLLFVNFWRVCLDEAQMVSSVLTKPAKLVAQLSAENRWVVTGTPIQKSIDDLYGLIYFLGCSPYNEREKWIQLINEFHQNANIEPIVSVLQKVMWRTCKSKEVMDQVNIPVQDEITHFIDMNDVETFYYKREHARESGNFYHNSIKIGAKQKLATLNPHLLKMLLEPLRKLRQDCSVPSVSERNFANKRCVKPHELLKHLVGKNEIEAKSELRSIAWCSNGIAGLNLIRNETDEAVKQYRSVLKWSQDYNEKISVDSLLQIHAIHNLLLVDSSISDNERQTFEAELNRLETKYLEKYWNNVKNHQIEQTKWEKKIDEMYTKLELNEYQWWINALKEIPDSEILLRKIQSDIKSYICYDKQQFQAIDFDRFRTIDGLIFVLTLWMDKLLEERDNVLETFQSLRFYIDNFKPVTEIKEEHREKMQKFLNQAYECHLKVKNDTDQSEEEAETGRKAAKRRKKEPCELCLVKQQLKMYESVVVDSITEKNVKIRDKDEQHDVYSWKAPYQEAILKLILSHIRNIDIEGKEDGKTLLQLLDAFRNECKEYSQMWVEVNFTVSAYDELKMCKSRTQAIDPAEYLENPTLMDSNLIISKYEVDEQMENLTAQKREAELNFVRKLGQLKYLNHLNKNKQIEDCPICSSPPESKYIVLNCGHHCCFKCFLAWKATMRKTNLIFKCHICRHQQSIHNLYYVTLRTEEQLTDSSSKFEAIVQQIKKLTEQDPTVKIVIFSQWSYILGTLEAELSATNITFRSRLEKFYQTIKEFKDPDMNVTCLLLPLSYGSKGLNLIEATHVFFVEPILDTGEEAQAIGRIHRIGQTKKTYVHRFILRDTIEEKIHNTISHGFWSPRKCTVEDLMELFRAVEDDS